MIVTVPLIAAILLFCVLCYTSYQDPRYAVQDPFTLWGFGLTTLAIVVLGILKQVI